jgi:hypothetical protein
MRFRRIEASWLRHRLSLESALDRDASFRVYPAPHQLSQLRMRNSIRSFVGIDVSA